MDEGGRTIKYIAALVSRRSQYAVENIPTKISQRTSPQHSRAQKTIREIKKADHARDQCKKSSKIARVRASKISELGTGARERIRTSTTLRPLPPQGSASASFATRANVSEFNYIAKCPFLQAFI